jgi:hypothetical protein
VAEAAEEVDALDALDAAAVEMDEPQQEDVVCCCRCEAMVLAAAVAATAGELPCHHHRCIDACCPSFLSTFFFRVGNDLSRRPALFHNDDRWSNTMTLNLVVVLQVEQLTLKMKMMNLAWKQTLQTPEDQALAAIDEQAVHLDDGEAGEDQPTPDLVPEIPGAPLGWHPPRPPDNWDPTIKTDKGEPEFTALDNPGNWDSYSYQPYFFKTAPDKKASTACIPCQQVPQWLL